MRIVSAFRAALVVFTSLVLSGGGMVEASLYNVSNDWSDEYSGNPPWSYHVNLPGVGDSLAVSAIRTGDPGGGTSFDAPGAPRIWTDSAFIETDVAGTDFAYVGWSKSNGSEAPNSWDLMAGDVYGYTPDNFGGDIEIRWTSPLAGVVHIWGAVWPLRDAGAANTWWLTLQGAGKFAVLGDGEVGNGYPYSRSDPSVFDLYRAVEIGDTVAFRAQQAGFSSWSDYVAMDLSIEPVPIPGAALLGTIGLGVAGWGLRRRDTA